MEGLLSTPGLRTDYIHISAITTAAAHIWTGAQRSPRFRGHADIRERLQELFQPCLQSLHALLPDIDAQAISNGLWSSATISVSPDELVPGVVHALTSRFLQLIDVSDKKQRPNAQATANVLWAFATMGHPAATAQVLDAICLHFGRLVDSPTAQQRPNAQAISNLLWALGILKHTPPNDRLLDRLCEHMLVLLRSHDQRSRPNTQDVAHTVWALAQLRHVPSCHLVAAMFDCMVGLCRTPGLQPNSQHISNCFIGCAELGLDMKATCVEALLKYFMEMHISGVDCQDCCNLAWSLAVMQCLDLNTFEALLDKLITMQTMSVLESSSQDSSAQLNRADVTQLHQALAWLMPSSGSKQMASWFKVQSRLLTIAPEPAFRKMSFPGQTVMWAALAMQGVPYQAQVQRGIYQADALLCPHDNDGAEVILVVERHRDFIKNVWNRLLGSAAFRHQLLARYGTVVAIPYNPDISTAESMADDIKAAVEAKTGLSLDSFRS